MARISERSLNNDVFAKVTGQLTHLPVAFQFRQNVGNAGNPSSITDTSGHDFVVNFLTQLCLGKTNFQTQLLAELLGLIVEKQEHGLADISVLRSAADVVDDLLVFQHVIVDIFDRCERTMRDLYRRKDAGMLTVKAVDITDKTKVADSFVDPQQIKIRHADEVDRCFVAVEEQADVRNAAEGASWC